MKATFHSYVQAFGVKFWWKKFYLMIFHQCAPNARIVNVSTYCTGAKSSRTGFTNLIPRWNSSQNISRIASVENPRKRNTEFYTDNPEFFLER